MRQGNISRRNFIANSALALSQFSALNGCTAQTKPDLDFTTEDRQAMTVFAQRLFPLRNVDWTVYKEITDGLFIAASSDKDLTTTLQNGIAALQGSQGNNWLASDKESQIEIMNGMKDLPVFNDIHDRILTPLIEHPDVWQAIGYGGPSLHLGGYIGRGFDDIDWLPEDGQ